MIKLDTEPDLDVIQIRGGGLSEATSVTIATISGGNSPSFIYIPSNMAVIKFMSDSNVQGEGFVFHWEAGIFDMQF